MEWQEKEENTDEKDIGKLLWKSTMIGAYQL